MEVVLPADAGLLTGVPGLSTACKAALVEGNGLAEKKVKFYTTFFKAVRS